MILPSAKKIVQNCITVYFIWAVNNDRKIFMSHLQDFKTQIKKIKDNSELITLNCKNYNLNN